MYNRWLIRLLILLQIATNCWAQQISTDSINKKKLNTLILIESGVYASSMAGLGTIWYKDNLHPQFNFFNDNKQWNGLDKAGHIFTAYQLTALNADLLQNKGLKRNKAYLYSALASSVLMLSIEIFDGFSPAYGASIGDIMANSFGAFLPFQELIWDEVYIHPKYSFQPTKYAELRPEILGKNTSEQWLKDYNGQTYWVSTNFNLFSTNNVFPQWLAFSIGYGAEEMVYGSPVENEQNGYVARRQLFLSLDFDFSKINTNRKWLKPILYGLNMLKVPFPTIEFNQNGVSFHPLYF